MKKSETKQTTRLNTVKVVTCKPAVPASMQKCTFPWLEHVFFPWLEQTVFILLFIISLTTLMCVGIMIGDRFGDTFAFCVALLSFSIGSAMAVAIIWCWQQLKAIEKHSFD